MLLNLSRVYKRHRTSAALDRFNNKQKKHLKSKEKIKFESNLKKRQSLNYAPVKLKKFQKNELKMDIVNRVFDDLPEFIPIDIVDLFQSLQNS